MRINRRSQQLEIKIVYYGPGLSGKTTNLAWMHANTPEKQRGRLVKLDTETERTLFFDYFPFDLGEADGYAIKVDFFTVPGQSFYQATRRAVLEGVDGIIFVADSHVDREDANVLAREDMVASLAERGRALEDVPHIYQWNKRDVDAALSPSILDKMLNPEGVETVSAVATTGEGVLEATQLILDKVMNHVPR